MATARNSGTPVLWAPAHWQTIDFISDLHLAGSTGATFAAWQCYMDQAQADALFILGDFFEVWVGDDALDGVPDTSAGLEASCRRVLRQAAQRMNVHFMHGNRDFLVGPAFAKACNMTLLDDPTCLVFDRQRWLLSHGDALCLGDTDYQRFREQVRTDAWREQFLSRPLAERQTMARHLREQSESRKTSGALYADVDPVAASVWLKAAGAGTLIHGHTHRPGDHCLDPGDGTAAAHRKPSIPVACPLRRLVLSDWDATAQPPRLQVLRLQAGQAPRRLDLALRT